LAGKTDVAPGFGDGIGIDAQAGFRRWGGRYAAAGEVAGKRHQDAPAGNPQVTVRGTGKQAAAQGSQQNRHKGAGLHQRIAPHQFVLTQMLGEQGVLDRTEQG
jgi:hypothetical protein